MSEACAAALRTAFLSLIVAGCATSQEARRVDRSAEYTISCWHFGWYICYNKATELCGDRFKVLSENDGLNGRVLRIACPVAPPVVPGAAEPGR